MTYEAVHARPDGDSTVARLALTASEYGYAGIVVRNHGDSPASFEPAGVADHYDIDVVTGVEIRAETPGRASGFLGSHRPTQEVVAVHGGDPAMNRFAVEQPAVDVLAHPMAGDGDVNHVIAREAADNDVSLELSLGPVLQRSGEAREVAIRDLRTLADLVEAYDAPFVVSADPTAHLALRAPRELSALGEAIGIGSDLVETGLAAWGDIAERNRERLAEDVVEPGVRRGVPDRTGDEDESS